MTLSQLRDIPTSQRVRRLAEGADDLGPTEFLRQYNNLVAQNRGRFIRDLHAQGYSSGQVAKILEDVDFPPTNTIVDGVRASDADRPMLFDPERYPTVAPHENGTGTQVVIAYGPNRGQLATVVNSRNLDNGYLELANGDRIPFTRGGFPILDSEFDLVLDAKHLGTGNEGAHFPQRTNSSSMPSSTSVAGR